MTDPYVPTIDPSAAGFDPAALDALREKVRQQVDEGRMPACQFAFAIDGELALFESYGTATPTTRFNVFSATKAFIGGVVWQLIGEGRLTTSTRAIELIPGFGTRGRTPEWMAEVTLEHLLTHTSGFPYAPLGPPRWDTRESRLEVFSRWFATAEPGTAFVYHPTAAHWVVAEMIETLEGKDYRQVVAERIIEPLGLRSFSVGAPPEDQHGIAELQHRRRARDLRGDGRADRRLRPDAARRGHPDGAHGVQRPLGASGRGTGRGRHRHGRGPGDVLPGAAARPRRALGRRRARRRDRAHPLHAAEPDDRASRRTGRSA